MSEIPLRSKPCVRCGKAFDPNQWYTHRRANGKVNYRSYCRACSIAKSCEWQTQRRNCDTVTFPPPAFRPFTSRPPQPVRRLVAMRDWPDRRYARVYHVEGKAGVTLELYNADGLVRREDFETPFDALLSAWREVRG